jgi:Zn-dependent protease
MQALSTVFGIVIGLFVLVFAIIIHEVAHGWVAEKRGDPTARRLGRITLNPLPHIDLFGSLLIPGFLILASVFLHTQLFIIGWAKPVPIDIRRFRNPLQDFALTALAGPVANLLQVVIYLALYRLILTTNGPAWLAYVGFLGAQINFVLALFNLIPIPPLDGSRLVAASLPTHMAVAYLSIERFGFMIIFALMATRLLQPLLLAFNGLLLRIVAVIS